jgi:hypothetical protein
VIKSSQETRGADFPTKVGSKYSNLVDDEAKQKTKQTAESSARGESKIKKQKPNKLINLREEKQNLNKILTDKKQKENPVNVLMNIENKTNLTALIDSSRALKRGLQSMRLNNFDMNPDERVYYTAQSAVLEIPVEIQNRFPRLYKLFKNRQRMHYKETRNGETRLHYNTLASFIDFSNSESVKMLIMKTEIAQKYMKDRLKKTKQAPLTAYEALKQQENLLTAQKTRRQRLIDPILQAEHRGEDNIKMNKSGNKATSTRQKIVDSGVAIIRGSGSNATISFAQTVLEPLYRLNKCMIRLDAKANAEHDLTAKDDIEAAIKHKMNLPANLRSAQQLRKMTFAQVQQLQKDLVSLRRSLEICESLIEQNPKRRTKKGDLILNIDTAGRPRDPKDYFSKQLMFNYKRIKREMKSVLFATNTKSLVQAISVLYQYAEVSVLYSSSNLVESDLIQKSALIAVGLGIVPISADTNNKVLLNACQTSEQLVDLYQWQEAKNDRLKKITFLKAMISKRAKPFAKQKEMLLVEHIADEVDFDGSSFIATPFAANTGIKELLSEKMELDDVSKQFEQEAEKLEQRAFDLSETAEPAVNFRFQFDNSKTSWDPQLKKFTHLERLEQQDPELLKECKTARPAQPDSYQATFFYMMVLKNKFPLEYKLLQNNGFMQVSTDHDNYTKQCKAFTSQLKYCYSALMNLGYTPTVLFELEQMTGFRTANINLSWPENIEEWVNEKQNMNTPLAAVLAQQSLRKNLPRELLNNKELTESVLDDASVFNASGTAKGEAIRVEKWHEIDNSIPARMRMNKTSYNMSIDWKERDSMIYGSSTMYGFPIQKKEVTKVRYIVNTDLASHFQLSPVEALISKIAKQSEIYNMRRAELQDQDKRDWVLKPATKQFFCADQSSFDNNISAHSFIHSFEYLRVCTQGRFNALARIILRKFRMRAIFVMDKDNVTKWYSGMLSGWKITSQFDSLINLQQMYYTTEILKQTIEMIRVLGDDVLMIAQSIDTKKVIVAMNQQGLIQHPDKTITSDRYAEFLRYLYDSKTGQVRAYPTRLVPSILFNKPWNNPFMEDEWEGNSAMARIKVFRTFARRLGLKSSDEFITKMCAADVTNRQSALTTLKVTEEELNAEILQVEVAESRLKNKQIQLLMDSLAKVPIVTPNQLRQGMLKKIDVARSMAINYSTSSKTFINKIIKHKVGATLIPNRVTSTEPAKVAPFPRPWIRKLAQDIENEESRLTLLAWGERGQGLERLRADPFLQKEMVRAIAMESKYKDEDIIVINVSEPTVSTQLQNIKKIANKQPTIEKANQMYKTLMTTTDWRYIQRLNMATDKVFD